MLPNALQPEKPFLDKALPGLLLIKTVSMLDELLKEYISSNELIQPRSFRDDLNGRIEYLRSLNIIENSDALHNLRRTRNRLAHDSSEIVTWESYENGISEIHKALLGLNMVIKPLKSFSCEAERSALETNVQDDSVLGAFTYTITVMEGDKKAAEYTWQESIMNE